MLSMLKWLICTLTNHIYVQINPKNDPEDRACTRCDKRKRVPCSEPSSAAQSTATNLPATISSIFAHTKPNQPTRSAVSH